MMLILLSRQQAFWIPACAWMTEFLAKANAIPVRGCFLRKAVISG
jgi:hypothetical protein